MIHTTSKPTFVKAFTLAIISCMIFAVTANAGVDSYSIYLNKKLLIKQSLDKPLTLQSLQLDHAIPNDMHLLSHDTLFGITVLSSAAIYARSGVESVSFGMVPKTIA